jgi:hypothetical protein
MFLLVLLVLNGSGIAGAEWVDTIIDAEVTTQYDDNINRSFFSGSIKKDDFMFVPAASFGRIYQLADFTRLNATANVKGNIHVDFDRLNEIFGGATLSVSHKFGVGPAKPWLRVYGSGGYLEVTEETTDLRDGWLLDTGITLGKRLTERIDVEVGYNFDYRNGEDAPSIRPEQVSSGKVFDQDGHTGSVLSNVLLTNSLLLSLGYSFRHGDITSTCDGATIDGIVDKIDAVARDLAYDEPLCAYRIRGDIHDFSVGTTYALNRHSSVNVNYNHMEGDARGLDYSNNLVSVSFNYSFQ